MTPAREGQMAVTTKYIFVVSMDVRADKEALFNEVYDTEHVPNLLKVPGVRAVRRWRTVPAKFRIGGQTKDLTGEGAPRYVAVYEIDSPDVLSSAAWAEATELGRWPSEVRPYTSNRHHIVREVV
jgi:hypothetical protein